jgi:hypothetical protein
MALQVNVATAALEEAEAWMNSVEEVCIDYLYDTGHSCNHLVDEISGRLQLIQHSNYSEMC